MSHLDDSDIVSGSSIGLIKNSNIDYEIRMTVVPGLNDKGDIKEIGKWLQGIKQFYIQQFRPITCVDKNFEKIKPFSIKEVEEFRSILKNYIGNVGIRGID